jgi:hypothetical protein
MLQYKTVFSFVNVCVLLIPYVVISPCNTRVSNT